MKLSDALGAAPIGIDWEELECWELFEVESAEGVTDAIRASFAPPLPARPFALVSLEGKRRAEFFGRAVFVIHGSKLTAYEMEH